MKKTLIISALAITAVLGGCQKAESPATIENEVELSIAASLPGDGTRTQYVPDGRKVIWSKDDKLGVKYKKSDTKNDNLSLTLVDGARSETATFKGKIGTTNSTPADNKFVFYYPQFSTVAKTGTVEDINDFTLGNVFPKIQRSSVDFSDAALMYGIAEVPGWPTATDQNVGVSVTMKNVMSILDFTIKGEGGLRRIYITDADPDAQDLWGEETISIKNGEVASVTFSKSGKAGDRTIIVENLSPVTLTAEGVHCYATIAPREFKKGISIVFELADGDYMQKEIKSAFTLAPGKAFAVPEVTFASTEKEGEGFYDGNYYTYEKFTDPRDKNVYRVATLSDGRTWMLDNLRYIPEISGEPIYTPSKSVSDADAGIWYPIIANEAGTALVMTQNDADVAKYGYLYSPSVAYGQDPEWAKEIIRKVNDAGKTTDAKNAGKAMVAELDGTQGICPDGWHIPTTAEYTALYNNDPIALGAQGFVIRDFGYLNVAETATTGAVSAVTNQRIVMTYILLSTATNYNQVSGIMTTYNLSTYTAKAANLNSRCGVAVRCIKNKDN